MICVAFDKILIYFAHILLCDDLIVELCISFICISFSGGRRINLWRDTGKNRLK